MDADLDAWHHLTCLLSHTLCVRSQRPSELLQQLLRPQPHVTLLLLLTGCWHQLTQIQTCHPSRRTAAAAAADRLAASTPAPAAANLNMPPLISHCCCCPVGACTLLSAPLSAAAHPRPAQPPPAPCTWSTAKARKQQQQQPQRQQHLSISSVGIAEHLLQRRRPKPEALLIETCL
jgi:hypothetical protein